MLNRLFCIRSTALRHGCVSNTAHAIEQPRSREFPVSPDRRQRDSDGLRGFLFCVSTKEAKFHNLGSTRLEPLQLRQRLIQQKQIDIPGISSNFQAIKAQVGYSVSSSLRFTVPRVVDENSAHLLAGEGEKMKAILD
jgi:hypothetical protein